MTTNSLNQQKEIQIKALRRLLAVAIIGFALLLVFQAITLNRSQLNYQNEMMNSVSRSILKELKLHLETQRLEISRFQTNNQTQLDSFYSAPSAVTEQQYVDMLKRVQSEFKLSRLYTLISPDGVNLLEHITGQFLPDCQEEVADTIKLGKQLGLFLHRSKTSNHYDLIQPRDKKDLAKGYFFVAFNVDHIANLLSKYQLPNQQLFLLRNDKAGFIEISSENNKHLMSTQLLPLEELAEFEYSLAIPNTRWSFAIRLDPLKKSRLLKIALWQSFGTWSVVTILLYLSFLMIRRNQEQKYQTQFRLEQSRKNAETIINAVNEAVFSVDQNHLISFVNTRAEQLVGKSAEKVVGLDFSSIGQLYYLREETSLSLTDIINAYEGGKILEYTNLILHLNQHKKIPVALKLAPIYKSEKKIGGYAITLEDLTTTIELSKRLVFHESKDALTGLDNRRKLEKSISQILDKSKQENFSELPALVLIDLDKFQLLNTTHGFEAGDAFLKKLAVLLNQTISNAYSLSRLSSDEFAVVFKNIHDQDLKQTCEKIKQAIREFKYHWHQEEITTSACLGVVRIDENFANINDVLAAADHTSRLAKTKGSNITQFYQTDDPELKRHAEEITRYADLKKAITQGNFVLYRQEIRATQQNETTAKYEVLIRMLDKQDNIIAPFHFLPAAEKYGLMAKIDRWVIESTFQFLAAQLDSDQSSYNINISSKTLSEKKNINFVSQLFDKYAIQPQRINFEITETSAISYLENALSFMNAMKTKGCSFSLDDFGTGLASFDYLRKLPIDFIKIDGVFVKDMQNTPNDVAFIEAIHKISSQMGIKTVAEFVENDFIFNKLKDIGINYAQGYFIHRPELWYRP